jgi:hypothetical protein
MKERKIHYCLDELIEIVEDPSKDANMEEIKTWNLDKINAEEF